MFNNLVMYNINKGYEKYYYTMSTKYDYAYGIITLNL